jgi:hypothetical protein
MTSTLRRVLPALCLAVLVNPAFGETPASSIRDEAGLFHADTIAQAQQQIDDIHRTFERNLHVETVARADPHPWRLFRFLRTPQVNHLMEQQARKRAAEVGGDCIYVVICNNPRDVHIVVQPDSDPEFTPHDAETLRRNLARSLDNSGPDAALLELVRQVRATLLAHASRGPSRSVVSEYTLIGILGGGLALWLVLALLRYKMRATRVQREEMVTDEAQRLPALLGAMLGCTAGLPIYDKLYPCPPSSQGSFGQPEQPLLNQDVQGESSQAEEQPSDERAEDAPVSP